MTRDRDRRLVPEWAWVGLLLILVFDVWWRGHTMGPVVTDRLDGVQLWPVVKGETEPLDCDEAAYAYMGKRLTEGAVLYRDLAENKPPGGYWIYQLAVKIGQASEWTIRWIPVPIVLLTILLLWLAALLVAGPLAACLSSFCYVLLSTDPYLYGNGAQLELPMNLFAVGSLVAILLALKKPGWHWPCLAGFLVGADTLVRQVGVVSIPIYALVIWFSMGGSEANGDRPGSVRSRCVSLVAMFVGFMVSGAIAIGVIASQGALPAMVENVIVGAAALVADTPAAERSPPSWMRWLTGNSDPNTGALPWPFGQTRYLVWWGCGSWPLWILGVGALVAALVWGNRERRLVAVWTLGLCLQVVLPRQYWAHYYLLPTPGLSLLAAILVVDAIRARRPEPGRFVLLGRVMLVGLATLAIAGTLFLQVRDYLLVPPEQLTIRYKGGAQWVRLRQIGRELDRKSSALSNPALFVWGWQSPLYFYSGLNSPSRHFFVNDLMKTQATTGHPLVSRWIQEILDDLDRASPSLVFTGYPPFPELEKRLRDRYQVSKVVPEAPALWVLKQDARPFLMEGRKLRTQPDDARSGH